MFVPYITYYGMCAAAKTSPLYVRFYGEGEPVRGMGDDGPQLAPARQNCPRSRAARGGDRAEVRGASRPGKGGVGGLFPDERSAPSPSGIACPNIQPAYWAN